MKKILLITTTLLSSTVILAQFGTRQVIDDDAQSITMVRAGDLDGDDDLDLAACLFDTVVWYENLDGQGNYGTPTTLVTGLTQIFSLTLADLDGDLDLDIAYNSFDHGWVRWIENLDGQGDFSTPHVIGEVFGANDIVTADLDGDLDQDAIVNGVGNNELFWFENLDGLGSFGSAQLITNTATNARSIFVADLDGDDDLDIVSSDSGDYTVTWFENVDGNGTFGSERIIAGSALGVAEIFVADLNGDLDMDVVTVTNGDDRVAWHENLDGLGNFGPQQVITNSADFAISVYAVDLDNDNDVDVISASAEDGKIAWYENLDGNGNFGFQQVLENEANGSRSVIAADLDGDNDQDVVGTLRIDDKLTWYKNSTIAGLEDYNILQVELVPNPVKDVLYIQSQIPITRVIVYDVLGKPILKKQGNTNQLIVSNLPNGLLFIKLESQNGFAIKKLVKE
ncbi:MAG: T9SS type A sorting domain-containing protein [Flavobacteriaceae bacterium]|nr:T9SS type A sorting domain-containing protein [Flavobacteriaceae bacterium]